MRLVNLDEVGVDKDNLFIHLARYMFVLRQLKKSDRVLEIGCGTGYGARLLSDRCQQVIATEAAGELQQMWSQYKKENLIFFRSFLMIDLTLLLVSKLLSILLRLSLITIFRILKVGYARVVLRT